VTIGLVSLALGGCTGGQVLEEPGPAGAVGTSPVPGDDRGGEGTASGTASIERVDPRNGGLEVALGEWALTLEAATIRPGRVTFVVVNRGTVAHGFEIESEDRAASGPGGGDALKAETALLAPGERTRLTLDLWPGLYKVECLVDGHDDLGMEGLLEVREDAPLVVADAPSRPGDGPEVSIAGFAFEPSSLEVASGAVITWTNRDPAPHTVTAEDGTFDSGTIGPGQSFSTAVEGNGPVTYRCLIHPGMMGDLVLG